MKHTPGPWEVDWKLRTNSGAEKFGYFEVCAKNGMFWVCKVLGFRTGESMAEYEANARLIAAAPELLEACKRARDRMYVHQSAATKEAVRLCDEAIAKAEGVDPATGAATADKPFAGRQSKRVTNGNH